MESKMLLTTDSYFNLPSQTLAARTLDLSEAMRSIDLEAERLCAGLSPEQLAWNPAPGKWSIAQNLAHLRVTIEVFLPAVDAAIEQSRHLRAHGAGPFRLRLRGRILVSQMESRSLFKLRAPKKLKPRPLESPAQELEQFLAAHAAMRQRLEDAEGLDLTAHRFPSPLTKCIRVNLLEFFSAFNAHSRRHLRQAHRVRQVLP
jgi:DinB superfamily